MGALLNCFVILFVLQLISESCARLKKDPRKNCAYSHTFNSLGDSAYLVSPKYPHNYPSNSQCTYDIKSPEGTEIFIECHDFNLQSSYQCAQDSFYFSLTGDGSNVLTFCDQIGIDKQTIGNRFLAGFSSGFVHPSSSHPFRFNCTLRVVEPKSDNQGNVEAPNLNPVDSDPGCSCGIRNWEGQDKRIVGGTTALLGEFPWRCMLYSEKLGPFCGCSVLSENYILTAAHCTAAVDEDDVLYVDLGDYDLTTHAETNSSVIKVARIIQNSKYSSVTQDFDMSLLKLERSMEFGRTIAPICLPWRMTKKTFHGATVTASGWGTRTPGGPISDVLQTVDLPILTTQECRKYYGDIITPNMICTYAKGRDTCQGDSGSSIDYYDKVTDRYYAIGVVSFGVGCAEENEPGVYSKITNFLSWIQENSDETFCQP